MTSNTKFEESLIKAWKSQNLSDSTIKTYMRNLRLLNDGKQLLSMNFTRNYDGLMKKINEYNSISTKKTKLAAIVSAQKALKVDNHLEKYSNVMNELSSEYRERDTTKKTVRQEKNWIDKEEIERLSAEMLQRIKMHIEKGSDAGNKFKELINNYLLLSLYTKAPARRNDDYRLMKIYVKRPENIDENFNYYIVDENKFIFNKHKTSKTYGPLEFSVPAELADVIQYYISIYPDKMEEGSFLITDSKGNMLQHSNGITRRLNQIFGGKRVGASMLRAIYLSEKYGDIVEQMKKDAKFMAHDAGTQKTYIKKD